MHRFAPLAATIANAIHPHQAILDGEICCLDRYGRHQFLPLLYRGAPVFFAFDPLWLDGRDLRHRPLTKRKQSLRQLLPTDRPPLLYLDHLMTPRRISGSRLARLPLSGFL